MLRDKFPICEGQNYNVQVEMDIEGDAEDFAGE